MNLADLQNIRARFTALEERITMLESELCALRMKLAHPLTVEPRKTLTLPNKGENARV